MTATALVVKDRFVISVYAETRTGRAAFGDGEYLYLIYIFVLSQETG